MIYTILLPYGMQLPVYSCTHQVTPDCSARVQSIQQQQQQQQQPARLSSIVISSLFAGLWTARALNHTSYRVIGCRGERSRSINSKAYYIASEACLCKMNGLTLWLPVWASNRLHSSLLWKSITSFFLFFLLFCLFVVAVLLSFSSVCLFSPQTHPS